MAHTHYSFDPYQQVLQQDPSGYGQPFFGDFEDTDACPQELEFAKQACLPQTIAWNQTAMQMFLEDGQRASLFNPLPQQILASNAQPVDCLPPVASHHHHDSPFSSQELSSCSSVRSPCADTELFMDSMPSTPPSMAMFPPCQVQSFEACAPHSPFFPSAIGGVQKRNQSSVSMTEVTAAEDPATDWTTPPVIDFSSPPRSYTCSSQTPVSHRNVISRQPSVDHEYKHAPSPALSAIVKEEVSLPEVLPSAVNMCGPYPTPSVRDSEGSDAEISVASPTSDENDDDDDDDEYRPGNKTRSSLPVRRTPRNKRDAPTSIEKGSPKRAKMGSTTTVQSTRPLPPSPSGSKGSLLCTECSHTFKDEVTLQSHIKKQHTRPFICVFRFAGCNSTFASKNEWKRHVMSQHLVLHYWLCDIDVCAHTKNSLTNAKPSRRSKAARRAAEQTLSLEPLGPPLPDGAIFNRKDLYTQHIRRMHTPVHVQKATKASKKSPASALAATTAEWDDQVKALQTSALRERCQLPTYMVCPAPRCTQAFSGADAWDQRMEHVARHLERAALGQEEPVVFGGPTDPSLMDWVTCADVAVVRSVEPKRWVLNNPLRSASEGRGVGRNREVSLASLSMSASAASSLAGGSSAVSFSVEPSPPIKNEIFVGEGDEDAEGEEE